MRYPLAPFASCSFLFLALGVSACSEDTKKTPDASLPGIDAGYQAVVDAEGVPDAPVAPDVPQEADAPIVPTDVGNSDAGVGGDAGLSAVLRTPVNTLLFTGGDRDEWVLANAGDTLLGPLTLTPSGEDSGEFTFTTAGCDSILPGKYCTVTFTHTPVPLKQCTRPVTFTATDPNTPGSITVVLLVTAHSLPPLQISPDTYDFGPIRLGVKSSTKKFTLKYSKFLCGNIDRVGPFTVTASLPDFLVIAETCSTSLFTDKGSCTVDIAFQPTTTGLRTGYVSVGDPITKIGTSSNLTGTGMPSL